MRTRSRSARRKGVHRPALTLAVLAVGVSSYALMQSLTVPTLPAIQRDLQTDQSTGSWVLTSFLLSASVATPMGGRLGDSFGKRRMLVVAMVALATGAVMAALASSITVMIVARAVQGLGGACLPLAFAIIHDELPPRRVPGAIALTSSLLAIGFTAGIVVAGAVVTVLSYRTLFLLPAATACLSAALVALFVPQTRTPTGTRVRLMPAALFTAWLVPLLLAVSRGPHLGWASPFVLVNAVVSIIAFGSWVIAERTVSTPFIHLPLLVTNGIWRAHLVALLIGMSMYASIGFLPQFNQTPTANGYGFGVSVTTAGYMMLPTAFASFVFGVLSVRFTVWLGLRTSIVLGCLATASGLCMFALHHHALWSVLVSSALIGAGTGIVFACLANAVVIAVPSHQTGAASGINANLRTVGGAIGLACTATIVSGHALSSGFPTELGYTRSFLALAAFSLAAALLSAGFSSRSARVWHPAASVQPQDE